MEDKAFLEIVLNWKGFEDYLNGKKLFKFILIYNKSKIWVMAFLLNIWLEQGLFRLFNFSLFWFILS